MPNPLLQRVAPEAMDGWLRAEYEKSRALQESKGGDATFYEIGANAPDMLDWYFKSFYEGIFYGGRVEVRIKELLRYRLSMTHGCAFCNKGNVEAARRAGVTDAQLDAIMNEASDVFDERERAVLRLGAEMVLTNMEGTSRPPSTPTSRPTSTTARSSSSAWWPPCLPAWPSSSSSTTWSSARPTAR